MPGLPTQIFVVKYPQAVVDRQLLHMGGLIETLIPIGQALLQDPDPLADTELGLDPYPHNLGLPREDVELPEVAWTEM